MKQEGKRPQPNMELQTCTEHCKPERWGQKITQTTEQESDVLVGHLDVGSREQQRHAFFAILGLQKCMLIHIFII